MPLMQVELLATFHVCIENEDNEEWAEENSLKHFYTHAHTSFET